MNKLAILAFGLLLFFSTMLWYLANGSLNEYLKSQVELQGHYYTGQTTTLALANFSPDTNITTFNQLHIKNLDNYQAQHVLIIDEVYAALSPQKNQHLLTTIDTITINKLTLNVEQKTNSDSNIEQLIHHIGLTLANDYPEIYPEISAKIYAEKNPQLNAEVYAQTHPQSGPLITHTKQNKKTSKPQPKIIVSMIKINTLELNTIINNSSNTTVKHDVTVEIVGDMEGFKTNQVGGELLLHLLKLAK